MQAKLKIGDKVLWRGSFGNDIPKLATVVGIELVESGEKYGEPVESIEWALVHDFATVDLDNGHWAYGRQLQAL